LSWSQTGEHKIFGPDLVVEAEGKVKVIQENLKATHSRQKSYFHKRRKPLKFNVGDLVYLRVSPTKGVQQFGVKGKLAPRYVGLYEIIEECGPMAYRVRLPSQLAAIHDVFYVSQLKKCVRVPAEIVEQKEIMVEPNISYVERSIRILDQKERSARRAVIKMYKTQWNHHTEEEATWNTESYLNKIFMVFLVPSKVHTFHT
jgi:hypothetical protein